MSCTADQVVTSDTTGRTLTGTWTDGDVEIEQVLAVLR